jgi:hypothetical protein
MSFFSNDTSSMDAIINLARLEEPEDEDDILENEQKIKQSIKIISKEEKKITKALKERVFMTYDASDNLVPYIFTEVDVDESLSQ